MHHAGDIQGQVALVYAPQSHGIWMLCVMRRCWSVCQHTYQRSSGQHQPCWLVYRNRGSLRYGRLGLPCPVFTGMPCLCHHNSWLVQLAMAMGLAVVWCMNALASVCCITPGHSRLCLSWCSSPHTCMLVSPVCRRWLTAPSSSSSWQHLAGPFRQASWTWHSLACRQR